MSAEIISISRGSRLETPSYSDERAAQQETFLVLRQSGHFCHSPDWVVQELAHELVQAIVRVVPSRNSVDDMKLGKPNYGVDSTWD